MLCEFSRRFPKTAGEFLDRASGLSRSFREETLTDVLMGAMVAFEPLGIKVDFPDEPRTGADMEWIFQRANGSTHYRLLIQAKKLYGKGKIWTRRSYPEIFHRVPKTKALQSATLVAEAKRTAATYPLYLFYNHQTICDLAATSGAKVDGASLVSGYFINGLVQQKTAGKLTASKTSNLGTIQPKMFPLSGLLCSLPPVMRRGMSSRVLGFAIDGLWFPGISPSPELIRQRLIQVVGSDEEVPAVGEGRFEPQERDRSRFRVTFTSPSTDDEKPSSEG
ncbi:DUF6615 family protein [Brevundimonas sp. FT23028]|uniref:DUF6615 family protein n=1 Tax=Brevundimonas sp. FT23028 TaxID=3393748 RepID=UPI003B58A053